jgi:heterodisulfide reductase subunit A
LSRARVATAKIRAALAAGNVTLSFAGGTERFRVRRIPDSPCRVACPAGVNVKAYVGLIGAGDFDRALEVVRARNPLPGICGRICTHPCESECRRQDVDAPVAVRPLKRFIADHALKSGPARLPAGTPRRTERIAVIGSGPAGLTAANDLVRLGYQVTIFEACGQPGGMLALGIPPFRLPREVIRQEIDSIMYLGVRLEVNARIDDPAALLARDFAAVFYAPGAHRSIGLGLPLEDEVAGVVDSLTFLRKAYTGEWRKPAGTVLVVGGGNSAIDSARTALRLGARKVQVLYRRTRKEMPAAPEEVAEAEHEGVTFTFRVQPVELLHERGRLKGLRCIRNKMGEPDASGRRRPVPVPDSEFDIPATLVVSAVGQQPETQHLAGSALSISRSGTLQADPVTCQTSLYGLYAGGDVVTGPSTVIDAIAAGHRAARGIHDRLTAGAPPGSSTAAMTTDELELLASCLTAIPMDRAKPAEVSPRMRKRFAEVEMALTESEAVAEAKRCMRCGPCSECVRCHGYCTKHEVSLSVPGSGEEVQLRFAGLDSLFPDSVTSREVVVHRPGARPVAANAAPVICRVERALCRDCGRCVKACVHQAIKSVTWNGAMKTASVDPLLCRGCGHCISVCPSGALQIGCSATVLPLRGGTGE